MSHFLLVANDVAPSRCFSQLKPVLEACGGTVDLLTGREVDLEEVPKYVRSDTVVLLGMSSSAELSRLERAAGAAARTAGVPYGFYGDVRRCWARARPGAWFADLAPAAAFYFGINQPDADAAGEVFPQAQLFGTGNPLREAMAFPRYTRETVREKLGIVSEEKLVLVPGGKFPAGNCALWALVMQAVSLLADQNFKFQLVLSTHPGDRGSSAVDGEDGELLRIYEQLALFSPVPARVVHKDQLSGSDIVPGADLVIEHGGSIGIEAAYQKIPVLNPDIEVLARRFERGAGIRQLEPVEDGIAELVAANPPDIIAAISRLLTPEGSATVRSQQAALYPRPESRGAALQKIAAMLNEIASTA